MHLSKALKDKTARIGVIGAGYVGCRAHGVLQEGLQSHGLRHQRSTSRFHGRKSTSSTSSDSSPDTGGRPLRGQRPFEGLANQDVLFVVQTPCASPTSTSSPLSQDHQYPEGAAHHPEPPSGTTDESSCRALGWAGSDGTSTGVLPGARRRATTPTALAPPGRGRADAASAKLAVEVYGQIIETVVPVSSTRAPAVKLWRTPSARSTSRSSTDAGVPPPGPRRLGGHRRRDQPFGFMALPRLTSAGTAS